MKNIFLKFCYEIGDSNDKVKRNPKFEDLSNMLDDQFICNPGLKMILTFM